MAATATFPPRISQTPILPPPYADSQSLSVSPAAAGERSSSASTLVIIILISVVIVLVAIYFLYLFLSRRLHRTSSAGDEVDVVTWRDSNRSNRRVVPHSLLDSLPVFIFRSVNGNLGGGGDCAVCLSKFEAEDRLRLLPLCCHAFHTVCIDAWILSHQTCPLCRSAVVTSDADLLDKIGSNEDRRINSRGGSFRIEIGSISRRPGDSSPEAALRDQRSYSIGSFEYVVDENGYEIPVGSVTRRGREVSVSDYSSIGKESFIGIPIPEPPGEALAAEVSSGRNWLRDYVDRLPSVSFYSRAASFGGSGRFFPGSSRRNDHVAGGTPEDLEANRVGEAIGEFFRWLSET